MSLTKAFFERLHFDDRLPHSPIGRYLGNIRTIILITGTLTALGMVTYISLPKELNPAIQIPTVIVSIAYPGASSEDVETLVTLPVEESVSGLSDVTKVTSTSSEGSSTTVIEFASSVDPKDAHDDVQNAIDTITDFPADATDPSVTVIDFQDQPMLLFALAGQESASLNRVSDLLEEKLKEIPGVEKVSLNYQNKSELSVLINPETLAEKNLSWLSLSESIKTNLASFPGGTLSSTENQFALSQEKSIASLQDLRELPLSVDGKILPLESIARVEETPKRGGLTAYYANQTSPLTRAITFAVFKTEGADTQLVGQAITEVVNQVALEFPETFTYAPFFDGAYEIDKSFNQLLHDFLITFALVFINLFLFFGIRQSVITTLAIPLSFLATFLVMSITGISVSFIALFALLLALGILVDNAIVIISAYTSYYRSGKFTPYETALLVFRDFHTVILTTTLTTIWAFLPLLLSTGIIGEFIKPIPIVVSSALALSAGIALFIVLPFMSVFQNGRFPRRVRVTLTLIGMLFIAIGLWFLLPAGPFHWVFFLIGLILTFLIGKVVLSFFKTVTAFQETTFMNTFHQFKDHGLISFDTLSARYAKLLERILTSKRAKRMTLSFLIIFMLFSYALVPTGYVVNEFFPSDDQDLLYIGVSLAPGSSPEKGKAVIEQIVPEIQKLPELLFTIAEIGATPPTDGITGTGRQQNEILFTLKLQKSKERERTSTEITRALEQQFGGWNEGKLSVVQLSGGPPAGADLQLTLLGKDLAELDRFAQSVQDYLSQQDGVSNIALSIKPGTGKIIFQPNTALLESKGIALSESGALLRLLGSGLVLKEDVRLADTKYDVTLRLDQADFSSPDLLGTIPLITRSGDAYPLHALGSFTLEENPTFITREDEKRSLSITASVAEGYSLSTINADLERFAQEELNLPEGYIWKTGGVNDENNKSVRSILLAMLLSSALIFGTMAVQFNSFRKALIVLLAVPLAISGVFIFFALFGIPLSFPALIGVLALFGIVVNNSIIMVDKINRNMELGLPLTESIIEGASSRLEPILLTALTTIIGLIPITLSDPIWQGLGGAIIAGLTFSGVAKLFFIPIVYAAWFHDDQQPS